MKQRRPIESFRRATARRLRANTTDAEATPWRMPRQLLMDGSHFRRQVPIGRYVVDFACMAARLVIELDGSQHGLANNVARDEARTRWLEAQGYRVVRFWNNEIIENPDGVLETIYAAIYGSADREPLPLQHERQPKSSE